MTKNRTYKQSIKNIVPSGRGGFTLAELLVAMSIFAILVTISVGVFIQGLQSQRILTHLMMINNNAASTLEQIAREVRTGYWFCGNADMTNSCDYSAPVLNFRNYRDEDVTYLFDNAIVNVPPAPDDHPGRVLRNGVPITASDVDVKNLSFIVSQSGSDAGKLFCAPWRVTIVMEVGSLQKDVMKTVFLQTTVSSRVLPMEAKFTDPDDPNNQPFHDACSRNF